MIWDQLTSPELGKLDHQIPVVLPMAATEQHGNHLPLATDRLIAEYFVQALNKRITEDVLILPTVGVGCSDHHMAFPGSLTLSHEAFMEQVTAIVESVYHHGFRTIILFNSHGGNQAVGQVLLEQLGYQYPDLQLVMVTWWRIAAEQLAAISDTGFGGVGHAGEFETSLMLLIAPELVDGSAIQKGKNQDTYSWAQSDMLRSPKASYYRTMDQMTPNGIYGDPTAASLDKGKRISEVVIPALQQLVLDLRGTGK